MRNGLITAMIEAVILTGARGCVGRAVLAQLTAQNICVHAVGRDLPTAPPPQGVIWHRADLLLAADRARIAALAPVLIHCAWDVSHGSFWQGAANDAWHHASLDLARRFRAAGGGRIIALGTGAEYCPQAGDAHWDETRPLAPDSRYGQAKLALWRDLGALAGDDLVWARLFHLFGAGEDPRRLIPSLIADLHAGSAAQVQQAALVRDYASSAYIAAAIVALAQSGARGAFNIGSGQARPLGDLAQMIAVQLGAQAHLTLSNAPNPPAPRIMRPDTAALRAATGLAPLDLAQALAEYVTHCTRTA